MMSGKPERTYYVITVRGLLDESWSDWFGNLAITADGEGNTVLAGSITDQSALHGILQKIRDMNLALISIQQTEEGEHDSHRTNN
jgi:hypothetical protein